MTTSSSGSDCPVCSLNIYRAVVSYAGSVSEVSQSVTEVVSPIITEYADGFKETSFVTVTLSGNATITSINSTPAPTWVYLGATLTWPTSYAAYNRLEGAVATSTAKISSEEACSFPIQARIDFPDSDIASMIYPIPTHMPEETAVLASSAYAYLKGIPTLSEQLGLPSDVAFSDCIQEPGWDRLGAGQGPDVVVHTTVAILSTTAAPRVVFGGERRNDAGFGANSDSGSNPGAEGPVPTPNAQSGPSDNIVDAPGGGETPFSRPITPQTPGETSGNSGSQENRQPANGGSSPNAPPAIDETSDTNGSQEDSRPVTGGPSTNPGSSNSQGSSGSSDSSTGGSNQNGGSSNGGSSSNTGSSTNGAVPASEGAPANNEQSGSNSDTTSTGGSTNNGGATRNGGSTNNGGSTSGQSTQQQGGANSEEGSQNSNNPEGNGVPSGSTPSRVTIPVGTGSIVVTPASKGALVLGSSTLTPGGTVTINGVTVALPTDSLGGGAVQGSNPGALTTAGPKPTVLVVAGKSVTLPAAAAMTTQKTLATLKAANATKAFTSSYAPSSRPWALTNSTRSQTTFSATLTRAPTGLSTAGNAAAPSSSSGAHRLNVKGVEGASYAMVLLMITSLVL